MSKVNSKTLLANMWMHEKDSKSSLWVCRKNNGKLMVASNGKWHWGSKAAALSAIRHSAWCRDKSVADELIKRGVLSLESYEIN